MKDGIATHPPITELRRDVCPSSCRIHEIFHGNFRKTRDRLLSYITTNWHKGYSVLIRKNFYDEQWNRRSVSISVSGAAQLL
jgi:hypothetical protein